MLQMSNHSYLYLTFHSINSNLYSGQYLILCSPSSSLYTPYYSIHSFLSLFCEFPFIHASSSCVRATSECVDPLFPSSCSFLLMQFSLINLFLKSFICDTFTLLSLAFITPKLGPVNTDGVTVLFNIQILVQ